MRAIPPFLVTPRTRALGLLLLLAAAPHPCPLYAAPDATPRPLPPRAPAFAPDAVTHFQVELSPGARRSLRASPRIYVPGAVRFADQSLTNAGIHLKGSTGSFQPIDERPGLTMDLDRFEPGRHFQGLTKLHLNNSAEDPTRLHVLVGSRVFASVGLPPPHSAHARLRLDGRDLGLYVLTEGFTDEFILRVAGSDSGALLEPARGSDLDGPMLHRAGRASPNSTGAIASLLEAARVDDPAERHRGLAARLDLPRFLDFMAVEVLLGHRDGYTMARNNYRVLLDARTGRITLLPHGLDQLFGNPELPWKPHAAGLLARAVFAIPAAVADYKARLTALNDEWLTSGRLARIYRERADHLAALLPPAEARDLLREVRLVTSNVTLRGISLHRQLTAPDPSPTRLDSGAVVLDDWSTADTGPGAGAGRESSPDGVASLHLNTGPSRTSAAWRSTLSLPGGRYRFEGRARVESVVPLAFGKHHGAGLRVAGSPRDGVGLTAAGSWQVLRTEFDVADDSPAVELICELRAREGEAWFDAASLRLVRLD